MPMLGGQSDIYTCDKCKQMFSHGGATADLNQSAATAGPNRQTYCGPCAATMKAPAAAAAASTPTTQLLVHFSDNLDVRIGGAPLGQNPLTIVMQPAITARDANGVLNDVISLPSAGGQTVNVDGGTVRKPGRWTPGSNYAADALNKAWDDSYKATYHVHVGTGSEHRCLLGFDIAKTEGAEGMHRIDQVILWIGESS